MVRGGVRVVMAAIATTVARSEFAVFHCLGGDFGARLAAMWLKPPLEFMKAIGDCSTVFLINNCYFIF